MISDKAFQFILTVKVSDNKISQKRKIKKAIHQLIFLLRKNQTFLLIKYYLLSHSSKKNAFLTTTFGKS